MKLLSRLKLKKEANLLDSKWYVLKTFLAISTAYMIFSQVPLVKKDMISVLFGLVLTLEPVNRAGLKNGWDQIFATFIGAVVTSLIVLFFGVDPVTVGASVAITLYICLLINWKSVSAVALFTAIYMTQYLQMTPEGFLSVGLTFKLRFAALSSGILIAVIYNYLFSLVQYKEISNKRTAYLFKQLLVNMEKVKTAMVEGDFQAFKSIRVELLETTNQVEWIAGLMSQLHQELSTAKKDKLKVSRAMIDEMRHIGHLMFDLCYLLGNEKMSEALIESYQAAAVEQLEALIDQMMALKGYFEGERVTNHRFKMVERETALEDNAYLQRLAQDLSELSESLHNMEAKLSL